MLNDEPLLDAVAVADELRRLLSDNARTAIRVETGSGERAWPILVAIDDHGEWVTLGGFDEQPLMDKSIGAQAAVLANNIAALIDEHFDGID